MTLSRRRFLTVAAAFTCAPNLAHAATWTGRALGAECSVTVHGPRDKTQAMLAQVPRLLENFEQEFSLFRPLSSLTRLNTTGSLRNPKILMRSILRQVSTAHTLTGGLFDPTIQPVWSALAQGGDPGVARRTLGWHRVRATEARIDLAPGQALTFNGIAQGMATDVMRLLLAKAGATKSLINIGEYAALGGPFTLGLEDPVHGAMGHRTLTDLAIATSSPPALSLGDHSHILGPGGEAPQWSTVSVEAPSATLADALSTAGTLMTREQLVALRRTAPVRRITAVDLGGGLISL